MPPSKELVVPWWFATWSHGFEIIVRALTGLSTLGQQKGWLHKKRNMNPTIGKIICNMVHYDGQKDQNQR